MHFYGCYLITLLYKPGSETQFWHSFQDHVIKHGRNHIKNSDFYKSNNGDIIQTQLWNS